MGLTKSNFEDANSLFTTDGTGREIFQSRKDNGENSYIFTYFITDCMENYTCSEYATIDEMMMGFTVHSEYI